LVLNLTPREHTGNDTTGTTASTRTDTRSLKRAIDDL
jgi:hypothetical protein